MLNRLLQISEAGTLYEEVLRSSSFSGKGAFYQICLKNQQCNGNVRIVAHCHLPGATLVTEAYPLP